MDDPRKRELQRKNHRYDAATATFENIRQRRITYPDPLQLRDAVRPLGLLRLAGSLYRRRVAQHFVYHLFVFLSLHGARRINQFSAGSNLQQRHAKHARLMLVRFRKLT